MILTINQFLALDIDEKAEAVWEGDLIAVRMDKKHIFLLYWLDNFFVEVLKDRKENQIKKFPPFRSKTKLEPYLDLIQIPSFS